MEAQNNKKQKQIFEPGVKISKKSYIFSIKKPFQDVKRYKASHPDELSLSNIRIVLRHLLSQREGGRRKSVRPPVNMKAMFFKVFRYLFIFIVLAGLGLMLLSTMLPPAAKRPVPVKNFTTNYSYRIMNTEVISFRSDLRAYATLSINATNINETLVDMRLFNTQIPEQIILLKSRRYKAERFEEFRDSLKQLLTESGLGFNELHVSQLRHMPNVSMILIVPTGLVPSSFLGMDDPEFDIRTLLGNRDVIIYMGSEFDSSTIPENESDLMLVDQATMSKIGIAFQKYSASSLKDGFRMTRPSYRISDANLLHEGISVLSRNNGFLVAFPSALDDGWQSSGADAAHDVYSVIRNVTWLKPFSRATEPYVLRNTNKEQNTSETFTLFSDPYGEKKNLTAQFIFSHVGFAEPQSIRIAYVDFPIVAKGTLGHADTTLPTNICIKKGEPSCDLYILMDLNEDVMRTETMKIVAYKNNVRISETSLGKKTTQIKNDKVFYPVDLPSGDYVLKVEDDSGYVYAQSFLHVSEVLVKLAGSNWDTGFFRFSVYADGAKIGQKLEVKNINVSLDGRKYKMLNSTNGELRYYFSSPVQEGNHKFTISLEGEEQIIERTYIRPRQWWDNPLYQGMLVIAAIMGAVGLILKKPQSIVLQLDVPDFPPLSKTKVPVSKDQAKQIFNSVNSDYSWSYMPLKHSEIKNGFRKLSYKGRPILVSDYNLEKILDQLVQAGVVRKSMDLYGLAEWEAKSGETLDYLAVFRSLRDVFLNMSVHFTDLGERKDCDILVSSRDRFYVHIYTGPESINRLFLTLPKGKTILVFKDQESLESFRTGLYSSDPAFIRVKMYVENGTMVLATPSDMGIVK